MFIFMLLTKASAGVSRIVLISSQLVVAIKEAQTTMSKTQEDLDTVKAELTRSTIEVPTLAPPMHLICAAPNLSSSHSSCASRIYTYLCSVSNGRLMVLPAL